jgi:hypothetical protein
MSTTETIMFFREIHDEGRGRVDFDTFMKVPCSIKYRKCCCNPHWAARRWLVADWQVAERLQFFGRSLQLPSLVLAKVERRMEPKLREDLLALVHMHHTAMGPYYERLKEMLPDQARNRFEAAERDLFRVMDLQRKSAEVDTYCPIFAYRRFLLLAHHLRMTKYESETDLSGKSGLAGPYECSADGRLCVFQVFLLRSSTEAASCTTC